MTEMIFEHERSGSEGGTVPPADFKRWCGVLLLTKFAFLFAIACKKEMKNKTMYQCFASHLLMCIKYYPIITHYLSSLFPLRLEYVKSPLPTLKKNIGRRIST